MDLTQIDEFATETARAMARLFGSVWNRRGEAATVDLTKGRATPAPDRPDSAAFRKTE